eukprot:EG_transcript_266
MATAALLPRNPGYALSLNGRTNTEYAYSFPRRLSEQFTMEMWLNGYAETSDRLSLISISHPFDANVFSIADHVTVFAVQVIPHLPLPAARWFHLAVSVDLSAYPAYDVRAYVDGLPTANGTGEFTEGLTPADIEEEVLSIVFGQEQGSILAGFGNQHKYSGHLDDVRIWDTIRTAEEIEAWRYVGLTAPYPAGLVSWYTFDNAPWNATHCEDAVNASEQHRMYFADYANSSTAPTLPPGYAPPLAPLPRLALSTAPLCSAAGAAGGGLWVRVGPGGTVAVPVAGLYCNATDAVVTATVTAVFGGTVTMNSSSAVGLPLSSRDTILFTANSSDISDVEAGSGFQFTVTDGADTVVGVVAVLANSLPIVPQRLDLRTDEDHRVALWVEITDEDRDIVHLVVTAAPAKGTAQVDGFVDRRLSYTPPLNGNGVNLGAFVVQARDMWGALSAAMAVTVTVTPVTDPPQLLMASNFTIYRGQRISIPFQVVDVDGSFPFVILTDWPAASQGHLEAQDRGRTWTLNEGSVPTKVQWASGYGRFSSQWSDNDTDSYGIAKLLGTPQCSPEYRQCPDAWCPAFEDNCNDLGSAGGPFTFCSEFFEAKFATPLCLTAFTLWEVFGGDRVSRILVPSDRDPSRWKVIMERDVANSPVSPALTRYSVTSFSVCQVLWPVDTVRVEIDTCHREGWYQVDAVQMRGSLGVPRNVLNVTARLAFQATPGYSGPAEFALMATSCYGSFEASSEPITVKVLVRETPHVITVAVSDGWSAIDVGQLDCGPRQGNPLVLELPASGTLRYMGRPLNDMLIDLETAATVFEYEPFRCNALLADTFLVQLGPAAVVQVNIRGCTNAVSLVIPIVVPCVVGPACLILLALLWAWVRRGHRDNSRAPKDPHRDICVLFTDIQSSTLLWGELPDVMSVALDVHNAIIRKMIATYKCYEVKTIGDSFMVVVADPGQALQLALAIQEALFDHGGANELDSVYCRVTECQLPGAAYARLWRGLRVRVGMHYGRAQITFDETSKGYDYFGTVVNAAARIESVAHGGQIVASRELFDQVAHRCSAYRVATQPLGCVQLRGLPATLDLIQLTPIRFAEREFPPLRLDRQGNDDKGDPEDGKSEVAGSGPSSDTGQRAQLYPQSLDREAPHHPLVRTGTVTAELAVFHAYDMFYALKAMLQMHKTPEERKTRLRELCQQWHVPCKVATDHQENASVGKLALQLMGPVANQMHPNLKARASSIGSHGSASQLSPPTDPPFWDQSGEKTFARRRRSSQPTACSPDH